MTLIACGSLSALARRCFQKGVVPYLFCYRCCPQVWDVIMPQWMEAIKADVQPEELARFKVLLT